MTICHELGGMICWVTANNASIGCTHTLYGQPELLTNTPFIRGTVGKICTEQSAVEVLVPNEKTLPVPREDGEGLLADVMLHLAHHCCSGVLLYLENTLRVEIDGHVCRGSEGGRQKERVEPIKACIRWPRIKTGENSPWVVAACSSACSATSILTSGRGVFPIIAHIFALRTSC